MCRAQIPEITLNMPNIHYLPAKVSPASSTIPHHRPLLLLIPHFLPREVLDATGLHKFEDDVFIPTDEPHGTIQATVTRSPRSRL